MTATEILDDHANEIGSALFGGETAKEAAQSIMEALGESYYVSASNGLHRFDFFRVLDKQEKIQANDSRVGTARQ